MPPKKNKIDFGHDVASLQQDIGIDEAKAILGWRAAKKNEKGIRIQGPDGIEEVVLSNNVSNRPLSVNLAKQYADMMFKQEWAGQKKSPAKTSNGETFSIDKKGHIVSCAHRCLAIVIAEYQRQRWMKMDRKDDLKDYGITGPIKIKAIVITGVDGNAADTADTGKSRTLGDVLFRRDEMNGKEMPESAKKLLSKELAHALRLVWLRINGLRVARGPKLHTPEAIAFLEEHPLLHDALLHVYEENGGNGADGRKVTNFVTLGYAAANLYLAGYMHSDRDKLETKDLDMTRKPKGWAKAEEFWTLFAQDLHQKDNPIKSLHKILGDNRLSEQKLDRDALCTLITRAYMSWIGETDNWGTTRALKGKLFSKVEDKEVLNFERFGGFDLDRDVLRDRGYLAEEEVKRVASSTWKVGELAWVDQEDGVDPWFGRIDEFSIDGKSAAVTELVSTDEGEIEDGDTYTIPIAQLHVEEPEVADEPFDADPPKGE